MSAMTRILRCVGASHRREVYFSSPMIGGQTDTKGRKLVIEMREAHPGCLVIDARSLVRSRDGTIELPRVLARSSTGVRWTCRFRIEAAVRLQSVSLTSAFHKMGDAHVQLRSYTANCSGRSSPSTEGCGTGRDAT